MKDRWYSDKQRFIEVMQEHDWNKTLVARAMDTNRNTIRYWNEKHGVDFQKHDSKLVADTVAIVDKYEQKIDQLKSKLEEYENRPPDPFEIIQKDRIINRKDAELVSLRRNYKQAVKSANYKDDFVDTITPYINEWSDNLPDYNPPKLSMNAKEKDVADMILPFNDWHLGDIVVPSQVEYLNAYNLDIAALRQQEHIDAVIEELNSGYYSSIVITPLGDNFSGMHNIHPDEAQEEGFITQQLLSATLLTVMSTLDLLPHVPKIIFEVPSGDNHTRSTRKNNTSATARGKSWSTTYHELVAMALRRYIKDGRVAFRMYDSYKANFTVQNKRFAACHGHKMKGGHGALGLPIYGVKRLHDATIGKTVVKAKRGINEADQMADREARRVMSDLINGITDFIFVGHFHFDFDWRVGTGGVIILPSLKGTDTYVNEDLEKYSDAAQSMIIVHPRKGVRKYSTYLQSIMDDKEKSRYDIKAGTSILSAASMLNDWEDEYV